MPDAYHYNYNALGHVVYCYMSAPDRDEVTAFRIGAWRFGLVEDPDAIVLLLKWGGGCGEAPYNWHIVPPGERELPDPPELGMSPCLWLHLIDSDTGIIRAIRMIAPGFEFGLELENAIKRQAVRTISRADHDRAVEQFYARHPTPLAMFEGAVASWRAPPRSW